MLQLKLNSGVDPKPGFDTGEPSFAGYDTPGNRHGLSDPVLCYRFSKSGATYACEDYDVVTPNWKKGDTLVVINKMYSGPDIGTKVVCASVRGNYTNFIDPATGNPHTGGGYLNSRFAKWEPVHFRIVGDLPPGSSHAPYKEEAHLNCLPSYNDVLVAVDELIAIPSNCGLLDSTKKVPCYKYEYQGATWLVAKTDCVRSIQTPSAQPKPAAPEPQFEDGDTVQVLIQATYRRSRNGVLLLRSDDSGLLPIHVNDVVSITKAKKKLRRVVVGDFVEHAGVNWLVEHLFDNNDRFICRESGTEHNFKMAHQNDPSFER